MQGSFFHTAGGGEIPHLSQFQVYKKGKGKKNKSISASFSAVAFVLGGAQRVFQTLMAVLARDNTVVARTPLYLFSSLTRTCPQKRFSTQQQAT